MARQARPGGPALRPIGPLPAALDRRSRLDRDPHFASILPCANGDPEPVSESSCSTCLLKRVLAAPDRNKPLWELCVLRGLADVTLGVLSGPHCMFDGGAPPT